AHEVNGHDTSSRIVPHQNGQSNGHIALPLASQPAQAANGSDHGDRLVDYIRDRVAAVLEVGADTVDPDQPLMTLGLDSLSAMELKAEIDKKLGSPVPLSMLLEGSGIRELAQKVSERLNDSPDSSTDTPGKKSSENSEDRLSHGQQMLWYAHQ